MRFVLSVLVYGSDWLLYQLKAQLATKSCFLKFIKQTNKRKLIGLLFEKKILYQQKFIDLYQHFQDTYSDALILRNCSVKVCQLCIIMNEKTA